MSWLDWLVVIGYLAFMVWDGIRMTKHSKSVEGYFLASRSLPWWAVGLSVMATQLSAITLVGTTGQGYSDGMRFIQFYYGLPLAMIILCLTAVPFFYRAKVYTAYEYLERRFDVRTRTLTSFFFLISRALAVGVIIAAPSVILSIVLGWNEITTIFVMGLSTTVYTMFGGVQAVTWTDVKQMFVIFFGMAVCLFIILSSLPAGVGLTDGLHLAGAVGKLNTIETKFDISEKYTIWSGLIGGLFLMLAYFGCDQSQVQRYLTAKSVSEGRTSLLMSAFIKIPMQFFILLIGIFVFVFYQFNAPPMIFNESEARKAAAADQNGYDKIQSQYQNAFQTRQKAATEFAAAQNTSDAALREQTKQAYIEANGKFNETRRQATEFVKETNGDKKFTDVNYIFPTFVINNMPIGVIGLIIAAIFAGAMSSISAELNSLATATVIDFYRRLYKPDASDEHYVGIGKIVTVFWGIFACIVAVYATSLGSLIEVVNKFGSFFYGSLLGVFALAFLTKKANGTGASIGLVSGIIGVYLLDKMPDYVAGFPKIEFLWFNVIGCFITFSIGYLVSILTGGNTSAPVSEQSLAGEQ